MSQFNTLDFAVFLALAMVAVRSVANGRRGLVLLAFCAVFAIAATNEFVAIGLFGGATITFAIGRLIQRAKGGCSRRLTLLCGLVFVWAGALFSSRYDWLQSVTERSIILFPALESLQLRSAVVVWSSRLGTSFIALRLSSYLIECTYRQAGLGFTAFLNYVMFFPGFTAGPVDRPWIFADKLTQSAESGASLRKSVDRILTGFVKKYVLADMIQPYSISKLSVASTELPVLWLGLLAYCMYIYWDFSGYTDIALGVGGCLGIQLPENFNRPYLKGNLSEFWNSWHMSFSTWLRDYVFSPLNIGLGRAIAPGLPTAIPAIVVTMAICGLWHGYTLGFLIWGLYHGIGLSLHRSYQTVLSRWLNREQRLALQKRIAYRMGCWAGTFAFVALGWVWFAFEPGSAIQVYARLFGL